MSVKDGGDDLFDGFSLRELMSKDGIQFDMGDNAFEENDLHRFNPSVNLSGADLLAEINMHEFWDDTDDFSTEGSISLGLNFDKIKSKLVDLTPDGRVKKKTMQQGTGDIIPNQALAIIKYSGYFEGQDEPFDSTHARGTTERYTLGGNELIYGLDYAIQSMKKNEIAIFWIEYTCAYGELGCPPLIPPRADVMFIVQLVDYLDSGTVNNFENLSLENKKSYPYVKLQVNSIFRIAADNFKHKKYRQAIRDYKRIICHLEDVELENEEEDKETQKLLSRARQNLAICFNFEDMPRLACIECHAATHKTAKIYYQYGKALVKLGEYSNALIQLNKSLEIEPGDHTVISEINKVAELQKKYKTIEKKMWSNCLNNKEVEKEKDDTRDKLAKEFVELFVNDNSIQRQEIPSDIDETLLDLIRKHATLSSMNIATITRYNTIRRYIQKPDYV